MLSITDKRYAEIKALIEDIIDVPIPIVNSSYILQQPVSDRRIEFKLVDFMNVSHNYTERDVGHERYALKTASTYKARLIIRVISTPEESRRLAGLISNAMQIFEYRDNFIPDISLLNHTLRQTSIPVEQNGVIYNLEQIAVECNMVLEYEKELLYFDRLEDVEVIIKEK